MKDDDLPNLGKLPVKGYIPVQDYYRLKNHRKIDKLTMSEVISRAVHFYLNELYTLNGEKYEEGLKFPKKTPLKVTSNVIKDVVDLV